MSLRICSNILLGLFTGSLLFIQLTVAADLTWDKPASPELLQILDSSQGLKVLWWNIHGGTPNNDTIKNQKQARVEDNVFDKNLLQLVESKWAPDVLIFATYRVSSLLRVTDRIIRDHYPYTSMNQNVHIPGYGIMIFSRYPIERVSRTALDYLPADSQLNAKDADAYRKEWCETYPEDYCTRSLVRATIRTEKRTYEFVTTHLFDQWRQYKNKKGKIKTGLEVLYGDDGPLSHQLTYFLDELAQLDEGKSIVGSRIIVGDFNIAKSVLHVKTQLYYRLSRGLRDEVIGHQPTFPAASSYMHGSFPEMQIDHLFSTGDINIEDAVVLPLAGSTHYPIYFVIK